MNHIIRKYLQNRQSRMFWKRLVTIFSCIVVFCTTYMLILPAITMERETHCGIEEHQHDESCYEERLICGQKEGKPHHHTDDCYTVEKELICKNTEHAHSDGCYDKEGNLTCALEEHFHSDECYREDRILSCSLEETDGHTHSAGCYEKVLVCGKETHTHSAGCYVNDDKNDRSGTDPGAVDEDGKAAGAGRGGADGEGTKSEGNTVSNPLDLAQVLTEDTSLWYHKAGSEEGRWDRITDDTLLERDDIVILYYAYRIPAGTLRDTNPVIAYPLPESVQLTDRQLEIINTANDGRGAQAIEGTRTPDQKAAGEEYVSAYFKVENIIDEDAEEEDAVPGQDIILTFDSCTIDKNRDVYDENGNLTDPGEDVYGFLAIDINTDQIDFEKVSSENVTDTVNTDEGIVDRTIEKTISEVKITLVKENKGLGVAENSSIVQIA